MQKLNPFFCSSEYALCLIKLTKSLRNKFCFTFGGFYKKCYAIVNIWQRLSTHSSIHFHNNGFWHKWHFRHKFKSEEISVPSLKLLQNSVAYEFIITFLIIIILCYRTTLSTKIPSHLSITSFVKYRSACLRITPKRYSFWNYGCWWHLCLYELLYLKLLW